MEPDSTQHNEVSVSTSKKWYSVRGRILGAFVFCIVSFCIYIFFISAPSAYPSNSVVTISSGENLKMVVGDFYAKHIVRSPVAFQSLVILFGGEKKVIAGDYLLTHSENAITLALRIVSGTFGMEEVKVTIPEGFSTFDIADTLEQKLVQFDRTAFLKVASPKEGYLFPDTYFFPPASRPDDIVLRMENNFSEKIKMFEGALSTSTHTKAEIVTMASILEGEATSTKDRQIVAGILWNRIKKKIPLQVDATFRYINGKTTETLTLDDLKIDSPYNTYVYRGLPPTPINNPGADALFAALHPIQTKYVYFLTGKDGVMHYAITFEEHKKNKEKYLR